jgi:hypothetical protein
VHGLSREAFVTADSCVQAGTGWGGITLAHCVPSTDEVRAVTEAARAAGATVAREPAPTFWGGYDSIIIDPDGYPWEIAYNPAWTATADGGVDIGWRSGAGSPDGSRRRGRSVPESRRTGMPTARTTGGVERACGAASAATRRRVDGRGNVCEVGAAFPIEAVKERW